ncbi:class I SAM-dependent methyltransferase [Billgrantia kenyensis]
MNMLRTHPHSPPLGNESIVTRLLKPRMLAQLGSLEGGRITLIEGNQCHRLGQGGPLQVTLVVRRPQAWRRLALGGSLGAAESYIDGDWDVDDLTGLIRLCAVNMEQLDNDVGSKLARAGIWLGSLGQRLLRNTLNRARRNIEAHYDIGNDLFATFLDQRHWMYSSAVYPHPEASLEEASTYKLDRILARLDVQPHHHLLEIGTGWGGLAIHAARTRGCRVTTTTISSEQYEYTRRRVLEEGLESQVTVLKRDYRELEGRYDRLVSVEMIEAVGHQYLATYLATLDRLLKDDGLAMLQAITIRDQRFEMAKREVDFIKRHVFPGGFLPSHHAIMQNLAKRTSMNVIGLEEIGPHYARTLREWRHRFESRLDMVHRLGYDERFIRLWRYYLCYCEAGFMERLIGTSQLLLAKPGARPAEVIDTLA